MGHIAGDDRDQMLLLPEAVDDYVGVDNPVRFIDAFVDGLDLAALGFVRAGAKATGRPGYAPGDLLKLYIYGYLNRVRSSRRLEAECHRNIEVIWLLRRLRPDFKTIAASPLVALAPRVANRTYTRRPHGTGAVHTTFSSLST
jgi:transposase